jgi:hypothetical protein
MNSRSAGLRCRQATPRRSCRSLMEACVAALQEPILARFGARALLSLRSRRRAVANTRSPEKPRLRGGQRCPSLYLPARSLSKHTHSLPFPSENVTHACAKALRSFSRFTPELRNGPNSGFSMRWIVGTESPDRSAKSACDRPARSLPALTIPAVFHALRLICDVWRLTLCVAH